MKPSKKSRSGMLGEEAAQEYLRSKGYGVLSCNWRWHHYELDIVARTVDRLVVVEVKTRGEFHQDLVEEMVNEGKIRRTVRAAEAYVEEFDIDLPVRFDLIFVVLRDGKYCVEEHFEDAFEPLIN